MRRGFGLLATLLPLLLAGKEITLEWLSRQPRSYAKDFYIWRYLDQNITPAQADAAFAQIRSVNWKLIRRYAPKTTQPGFAMADRCHRLGAAGLPAKTAACSAIALTPYRFTRLDPDRRKRLINQLSDYPELRRWMVPMAAKKPFEALLQSGPDTFLEVFNRCGRNWRRRYLNRPIPPAFLKKAAQKRAFNQAVKRIVTDPALTTLQQSLLKADDQALNHRATFFLAMNALRHDRKDLARGYLADAYAKAWYRFDRDKVLFWLYRLDPREETLRQLAQSFDLNLYTLYAHEKLHTPWPRVVSPSFKRHGSGYDITDPFAWLRTLRALRGLKSGEQLVDYSRRFAYKETEGHYSFVMERAARWRTHYFPMPYADAYRGMRLEHKALLLALARQESHFIPASVSPSYALGMMQIMPFLVKELAKKRHEAFDLDAMLDPRTNIAYARDHLRYLLSRLHHPLLVAYAYNGGIGFTRRMLKERGRFAPGPYEPWLSMELVHYDESRRYGKKVLANYVVYRKILGDPIDVTSVVESAIQPSRRDRPRSR